MSDLPPALLDLLIVAWLLMLGGAIGSFLNVVAYRLPQGMSLIYPGSHCPACKHPIRFHDNVPVLGWLILRGRCRDCHVPISPRYPIVEAIAAAMFLAVGVVELLDWPFGTGVEELAAHRALDFRLWIAGAYDLLLLGTLLGAALIEFDRKPVPLTLFAPAGALGLSIPIALPGAFSAAAAAGHFDWTATTLETLAGAGVGLALGWVVVWIVPKPGRPAAIAGATLAGLFLGRQAALVVIPVAAVVYGLARLLGAGRIGPAMTLTAVSFAWILLRPWLVDQWPWLT